MEQKKCVFVRTSQSYKRFSSAKRQKYYRILYILSRITYWSILSLYCSALGGHKRISGHCSTEFFYLFSKAENITYSITNFYTYVYNCHMNNICTFNIASKIQLIAKSVIDIKINIVEVAHQRYHTTKARTSHKWSFKGTRMKLKRNIIISINVFLFH